MSKGSVGRVERVLERWGIGGEIQRMEGLTRTAVEAARACGVDVCRIVKSLVFRGEGGPWLIMAPGDKRVDVELLSKRLGEELGRADAAYVREESGFAIGGVSPVGWRIEPRAVMDEGLLVHETVWSAAGALDAVFEASPGDLRRATGARIEKVW